MRLSEALLHQLACLQDRGVFGARPRARIGRRPALPAPLAGAEVLEDRTLLTIYTVDTLGDVVALDGKVSLREAVLAANTNTAVHDARAGQTGSVTDFVAFDAALGGGTITLAGTELVVSDDLIIQGPRANRVTISGNGASRVFKVEAGADMTVSELTITGGRVTALQGRGGGIFNEGSLRLFSSAVVGNSAAGEGGGIGSIGRLSSLRLSNSTISGNGAGGGGGGIRAEPGAGLSIRDSTISGNSAAGSGGGLLLTGLLFPNTPAPVLRSVTVFGNRAGVGGLAGSGGGVVASGPAGLTLFNTLVAGNRTGRGGTADDVSGTLSATSSHNLVGDAATAGGLIGGQSGNVVGADLATLIDPVLRDNGGPTKTHALLPNSRAIDAGDDGEVENVSSDQRGFPFPRKLQARVDIGSFEAAPAADLVGYVNGQWWAGSSTGTKFTTALWASVPNAAYDALGEADFTGDGRADAFALLDGVWTVGASTGTAFAFRRWGVWSNADWKDVKTGDLNGDGKADILARLGGQWWAALSNGATFDAPRIWTVWATLPWREFFLADVTGDNRADLVGYQRGQWWVGASNGTAFVAPKLVVTWDDRPWQKLLLSDVAFGGNADLVGFVAGEWWVSASTGASLTASAVPPVRPVVWANLPYVDLLTGDFNGDGSDDLIGRNGGNWWVSLSQVSTLPQILRPNLFAQWSNLSWKDVRVADFDGDGRDDVTGRINGQWWVAESTGGTALVVTTLWATWSELPWQAVAGVDATGPPSGTSSGGGSAFAASASGPVVLLAAATRIDEPLALFWGRVREDHEFADQLLAAA